MTPGELEISAGRLTRRFRVDSSGIVTTGLAVDGHEMVDGPAVDVTFTISRRRRRERPRGLTRSEAGIVTAAAGFGETDTLEIRATGVTADDDSEWAAPIAVRSDRLARAMVNSTSTKVAITGDESAEPGLAVRIHYAAEPTFPAIRKWVSVRNDGVEWLKVADLTLDDLPLALPHRTPLTPAGGGAPPSLVSFSAEDHGVIVGSVVPSALRRFDERGRLGYASEHFEWVLGPGEEFVSEPIFHYGFAGPTRRTPSGESRELDRVVEGEFQRYLGLFGIGAGAALPPLWCTWTHPGHQIDDSTTCAQAELAAAAGFGVAQIDAGWQRDGLGLDPDPEKFPDLAGTVARIRAQGLRAGLWVSCFRGPESADRQDMPDAICLPVVERGGWDGQPTKAVGMSFASEWRHFYARSVANLSRDVGVTYVKQDLSNIRFGDIAEGHDSRTLKESHLRGLRGLIESQRELATLAPQVHRQITHEIYWGTPGVPCDLAILTCADSFHIPPNDYSGAGLHGEDDPEVVRPQLLKGCFNARRRLYEHRGLPLKCIEYYGAATSDVAGVLTGDIQDRQVCSWLMGAPLVYAGDLSTLSAEQVRRYRELFGIIGRLHQQHGIFDHFQYSGAPEPTDTGWHWWGKLNPAGEGAVVVLRGSGGEDSRAVGIPWLKADGRYRLCTSLRPADLGEFSGDELREGALSVSLPVYGQEIVEVRRVRG